MLKISANLSFEFRISIDVSLQWLRIMWDYVLIMVLLFSFLLMYPWKST